LCPKNKVKVMVILPSQKGDIIYLTERIKQKIWDFLKGGMSLAEVGWCYRKNESSIHSTGLNVYAS
jgi:hypothetical protein